MASSSLSFSSSLRGQWPLSAPSSATATRRADEISMKSTPLLLLLLPLVLIKPCHENSPNSLRRWTGDRALSPLENATTLHRVLPPPPLPPPLRLFSRCAPARRASHSSISPSRKPISWYLNYARFRAHRPPPAGWKERERGRGREGERERKKARCNIASFPSPSLPRLARGLHVEAPQGRRARLVKRREEAREQGWLEQKP